MAAFLVCNLNKMPVFKWDVTQSTCSMMFDQTEDLKRLVEEFNEGRALAEPRALFLVSGRIKRAMFSSKKG